MSAGYSGTPLATKLGIRAGSRVLLRQAPDGYRKLLEPLPTGVRFSSRLTKHVDLVHLFVRRRARLSTELGALRRNMRPDCAIWVSWPKRASGVETDITEDAVRELALPLGLVDIKVCAVDQTWSGLKLVIRKALRK